MRLRTAILACAAFAALPGAAHAADPIMPLSEVRSGMQCTGLSVVRGVEISSFDVEILDVIDGQPGASGPRILVRASGPAVDATGIGPGFSGSPIICDGRNAGAISEGIGDFGNDVVLATPIEEILGESPPPPPGARRDPALRAAARPLEALTVTGLSPRLARLLSAKLRRPLLATPAGPLGSFPPQELRPGSAAAVALSSGDIRLAAVGTVAYRDGSSVWLFGHPLDAAGPRSLLLQDAYVFTVVGHPDGANAGSFKLAAPGHDLGLAGNDALGAVVGTVGARVPSFPLRVVARNLDNDRTQVLDMTVADELSLRNPGGFSPFAAVASLGVAQALTAVLRTLPSELTGVMCMRIKLVQRERRIRFCNDYASEPGFGPGGGFLPPMGDVESAIGTIDSYRFGGINVESAEISLRVRRTLRQGFMTRVSAPRRVRAGSRVPLTVRLRMVGGGAETVRFRLRLPRRLRPGALQIRLVGRPADGGFESFFEELEELLLEEGGGEDEEEREDTGGEPGLTSLSQVAREIERLERYTGLRAELRRGGRTGARVSRAFRDRGLRISGRRSVRVRVVR